MESDLYPVIEFLKPEIDKGEINVERLFTKLEACLSLLNAEMKAFDIKTGKKNRVMFNDSLIFSLIKNGIKIPMLIVSPRFQDGVYKARKIMFGFYDSLKQPIFFNL